MIATDSFSVFLPLGELPNWLEYKSKGSILYFVVPTLVKQKIRGWSLCAIFARSFHDMNGFTIIYELKNYNKKITW